MNVNNSSNPLVTVYITCHNYGKFLSKAIESVISQLYKNWELFIVNDASQDTTEIIAENYRQKYPKQIKVISNTSTLGLQRNANNVLKLSNGRYIVRLDADDWFDEAAILLMVAKLESDEKIGIVYGNYFYTNEDGKIIDIEKQINITDQNNTEFMPPPHGACTMVRVRLLKSVGGYSEDIKAQDGWELWYKILQHAKASRLVAPLFYYRQHQKSLSRDSKKLLFSRNSILRKISAKREGSYKPSCLAVIPVRESSLNFKGIPYKEIFGKSLLQLAIESAQKATNVTEVAVSSTSKVLEFSQKLENNKVVSEHMRINRPASLYNTTFHPRNFLLHAGEYYKEQYGNFPDIIVFLNLHTPLRDSKHVDSAIDTLFVNKSDAVVSVTEVIEPTFMQDGNGLSILNPGRFDNLSHEKEKIFEHKGDVIAVWWEVLRDHSMFGDKISYVQIENDKSIKVNSEKDIYRLNKEI